MVYPSYQFSIPAQQSLAAARYALIGAKRFLALLKVYVDDKLFKVGLGWIRWHRLTAAKLLCHRVSKFPVWNTSISDKVCAVCSIYVYVVFQTIEIKMHVIVSA